jgi:hypothetical protein
VVEFTGGIVKEIKQKIRSTNEISFAVFLKQGHLDRKLMKIQRNNDKIKLI